MGMWPAPRMPHCHGECHRAPFFLSLSPLFFFWGGGERAGTALNIIKMCAPFRLITFIEKNDCNCIAR